MKRGNVLFIILLAISLFAALSFAVKDMGGRGTSNVISQELAETYAIDILRYASEVEQAVQRMLARGVSENDLCFDIDEYPGGDTTYEHAACADPKNRVFHPEGGQINYLDPHAKILDSSMSSRNAYGEYAFLSGTRIVGVGKDSTSSGTKELLLALGYIHENVCLAINKKLGGNLSNETVPVDSGWALLYTRYFTGNVDTDDSVLNGDWPSGTSAGCFQSDINPAPEGSYHFVKAIHIR